MQPCHSQRNGDCGLGLGTLAPVAEVVGDVAEDVVEDGVVVVAELEEGWTEVGVVGVFGDSALGGILLLLMDDGWDGVAAAAVVEGTTGDGDGFRVLLGAKDESDGLICCWCCWAGSCCATTTLGTWTAAAGVTLLPSEPFNLAVNWPLVIWAWLTTICPLALVTRVLGTCGCCMTTVCGCPGVVTLDWFGCRIMRFLFAAADDTGIAEETATCTAAAAACTTVCCPEALMMILWRCCPVAAITWTGC